MTSVSRKPEQYDDPTTHEFHSKISEFAADTTGAMSPFGDVEFPLPADRLSYQHPRPADRPRLAGADED